MIKKSAQRATKFSAKHEQPRISQVGDPIKNLYSATNSHFSIMSLEYFWVNPFFSNHACVLSFVSFLFYSSATLFISLTDHFLDQ